MLRRFIPTSKPTYIICIYIRDWIRYAYIILIFEVKCKDVIYHIKKRNKLIINGLPNVWSNKFAYIGVTYNQMLSFSLSKKFVLNSPSCNITVRRRNCTRTTDDWFFLNDHGLDLLRKLTNIRSCLALRRANLLNIAILNVAELFVS